MGKLANCSSLSNTIHTDEQDDRNSIRIHTDAVILIAAKQLLNLLGQNRLKFSRVFNLAFLHFTA
ncbi:hypothetical protein D3C85_1717290 [compost metagenome]